MFAIIETNGATHIAISVPTSGAEKSLPALANMLENNAVFIKSSWGELCEVTPKMTIQLANSFKAENNDIEIIVASSDCVIDDSFELMSPDIYARVQKMKASHQKEVDRLNSRVKQLESELFQAKEQIDELSGNTHGE